MAGGLVLGEVLALRTAEMAVLLAGLLLKLLWDCKRSRSLWALLLALSVAFGLFRAEMAGRQAETARNLAPESGSRVTGTVKSLEAKSGGYGAELTGCRLEPGGEPVGTVSVFFEEKPRFQAGDRIWAAGRYSQYSPATNPGEFDYRDYYESRGSFWKLSAKEWGQLPGGNPLRRVLGQFREDCAQILVACGGEKAGIFKAMLLGMKGDIPDEVYALYQENGISHLLAISGLHVSMLGMGLYGLLRRLGAGKRGAAAAGGALMACYGLMTGFSPSTQRAVIMFLVSVGSGCLGRVYDLPSALGLAGAVIAWREPLSLAQGGVQLSFLAVGGIGVLGKALERAGIWEGRLGTLAVSSLAVQLATYPAVLYHFFVYPPYGILLNLLVIPLMTYAMISGLLCLGTEAFCLPLGRVCIGSGCYILELYEFLCGLCGRLPGNRLVIGRPALWQVAAYGALLAFFAWNAGRMKHKKLGLAAVTAVLFLALFPLPERGVRVTYLDVGQGDGMVVEAEGVTLLLDGGSTDKKKVGDQILEPFLLSEGIRRVDYAVVSHCDNDHISGLKELLENGAVEVNTLILPALGAGDEAQRQLARLAEEKGIRVAQMAQGDGLQAGNMSLSCLYPYRDSEPPPDRNDQSLILRMDCGDASFLFTGDTGEVCEREMAARPDTRAKLGEVTVLKAAHHGSASSSCEEFLELARPAFAVLSYGEGNSYGHPAPEAVERLEQTGARLLETAKLGAVTVWTDGTQIRIHPFRKEMADADAE